MPIFATAVRWFLTAGLCLAALTGTRPLLAADPPSGPGVGPVKKVEVGPLDAAKAKEGAAVFETKCSACHKLDERYVGPALKGVTQRRQPEWIMNMILNPEEMAHEDPTAQKLLGEHMVQMTFQNVSQDDARKILEYFRQVDGAGAAAK